MTRPLHRALGLLLPLAFMACSQPAPGVARGEAIFDTCSPCHGDMAEGKENLGAPALAGASQWYLRASLDRFRSGARAYHHLDAAGLRMRPMSRTLNGEEDIESVVAYIMTLPPAQPEQPSGNAQAGGTTYQTVCIACHMPDGRGNESLGAPSLLHLDEWYIASSVEKFQAGIRGTNPENPLAMGMRPLVMSLDAETIHDVIAYIHTLR